MAAGGDDTEVIFLGTGAAEPSKYRGASAIHLRCRPDTGLSCMQRCSNAGHTMQLQVSKSNAEAQLLLGGLSQGKMLPGAEKWMACAHRLSSGGGLLLDAGEGCLAQLTRTYGAGGAAAQVAALAAVWVSHRHADHMLGLPALLAARPPSAPPLLVMGAWWSSRKPGCARQQP